MNAKQIWQSVLDRMQLTVSQAFFTTWFGGTTAVSLEECVLTVSAVSTFTCSQLTSHYYEDICYILSKLVGPGARVEFIVGRRDPEEELHQEPIGKYVEGSLVSSEIVPARPAEPPQQLEAVGIFTSTAAVRRPAAVVGGGARWDQAEGAQEHRRRLGRAETYSGPERLPLPWVESADAPVTPHDSMVVESQPLVAATLVFPVVDDQRRLPASTLESRHPLEQRATLAPATPLTSVPEREQDEAGWSDELPAEEPATPTRLWERPNAGQVEFPSLVNAPVDHIAAANGLDPRFVFKTFVVGKSNQLAVMGAKAVAEAPGTTNYNPLFIYGGVGLGKTHLLQAIAHRALEKGYNVLYTTADQFTNEIVTAIRQRTTSEFRRKYRTLDMLLVDDIQFIAGKEATEEEFFHTFNELHSRGKQVIVASDRAPQALVGMQDRLRSRFGSGLMAGIREPEYSLRVDITRSKAGLLGFRLSKAVVEYLAKPKWSSVRELEGSLNRVIMFADLQKRAITQPLATRALAALRGENTQRKVDVEEVVQVVCRHFQVSLAALRSKQRPKKIAWPRQVAMYLMREEAKAQLERIGAELGGRDHTTIMHGIEHVTEEIRVNDRVRDEVHLLRMKLREQPDE